MVDKMVDMDINFDENPKKLDTDFAWSLINTYFSTEHLEQLVRHQVESYNAFISRKIPNTIEMFNPFFTTTDHEYE